MIIMMMVIRDVATGYLQFVKFWDGQGRLHKLGMTCLCPAHIPCF